MSIQVLRNPFEITNARTSLRKRSLSCLTPWPVRGLRKAGVVSGVNIGDALKSWDVLNTSGFIERHLKSSSSICDFGAYASEIPAVLHKLGYSFIVGVDLNPRLHLMPQRPSTRYCLANFLRAPFTSESFDVVTAISVIEHGFQRAALLSEVCRLLKPGGYFIASFDYWPEKIDTSAIRVFGMDWSIFSRSEIQELLSDAGTHGLQPVGRIELDVEKPVIHWGGKDYTFAWMVLRKGL
jgi:SAM-dependent methyltransferase